MHSYRLNRWLRVFPLLIGASLPALPGFCNLLVRADRANQILPGYKVLRSLRARMPTLHQHFRSRTHYSVAHMLR